MTDAELTELYDRYAHVIFHRCLSILGNAELADDAVHETFAKVMRHGDGFRGESSPLTWMYQISTNYCLNQIRNRKGRSEKLTVHREEIVGGASVNPDHGTQLDAKRLRQLLEEADPETRRCVIHIYFDDCTRQEVADLVGLSVPTVRKRVNAFLDRARRVMAPAVIALLVLTWSIR